MTHQRSYREVATEIERLKEIAENYERAYKLVNGRVAKVLVRPAARVDGALVHHATFRIRVRQTDWHDNGAFTSSHSEADLISMTDRMLEMR
jgi:hypothetical protein